MTVLQKGILSIALLSVSMGGWAYTCPDPATSSLQWGEPPQPWMVSPYSAHQPQGEEGTKFVKANILVAGYGVGVSCTYENSVGYYSILRLEPAKIPSKLEPYWVAVPGGYVCSYSLEACEFMIAK